MLNPVAFRSRIIIGLALTGSTLLTGATAAPQHTTIPSAAPSAISGQGFVDLLPGAAFIALAVVLLTIFASVGPLLFLRASRANTPLRRTLLQLLGIDQEMEQRNGDARDVEDHSQSRVSNQSRTTPASEYPRQAIPDVPGKLVDAIVSGKAVLFAGFGLGVQAGLPSWEELLIGLISRRKEIDRSGDEGELYDSAIEARDWNAVAQLLEENFGDEGLVGALRDLYRTSAEIPKSFRDLAAMPFDQVFSFTWDDVLERAFRVRRPIVIIGDGSRLDGLRRRGFAIFKLNGDLRDAKTVRFSYDDYRNALFENPTFAKTIASLTLDHTLFYVGTSIESIRSFFAAFPSSDKPSRVHYALVPRDRNLRSSERLLLSRYNVQLLSYAPSPGFPEVPLFIERLRQQVAISGRDRSSRERTTAIAQDLRITHVALANIGPFTHTELNLNPQWNVLLGINGAGKSTVLRAIALALCGDDPSVAAAGEPLLKEGAERGTITVTIGDAICQTDLIRERGRVRLVSRRQTPLQAGTLLALGFPALRAASVSNPRGPAEADQTWPEIQDVAPLLDPRADRRLDTFKQWLVNLDARIGLAEPERRAKLLHVRDIAFAALRALSGNTEVRFAGVDTASWRVLVSTRDATSIPLDQISQGMTSLMAWVGIVIERLAELYPELEKPESAPAIVLVDEIDAQLHPEWQQELVDVLRAILPNVQIIATTHSPLIVGALEEDEIYVCRRSHSGDRSTLEIRRFEGDVSGLRADQILTSDAFEMETTRNPKRTRQIAKYEALVQSPSADHEEARRALAVEIAKFTYAGETPAEIEEEKERARIVNDPNTILNRFFEDRLTDEERDAFSRAFAERSTTDSDDAAR